MRIQRSARQVVTRVLVFYYFKRTKSTDDDETLVYFKNVFYFTLATECKM